MKCHHPDCKSETLEHIRFFYGEDRRSVYTCSDHKNEVTGLTFEEVSGHHFRSHFTPMVFTPAKYVPPNQGVTPIQASGSANVPTSESTGSEYQNATAANALNIFPSPFFYFVYTSANGSFYFCKNTYTGLIESQSSDASVVIQYAINNAQGTIYIAKGLYLCNSQINFSGFFRKVQGERTIFGLGGVGASNPAYDTILKKNYTDNVNGFIRIDGSPTYMKLQFQDLVIQGDQHGIGMDILSVNEMWDFVTNVMVCNFTTGMRFSQAFEMAYYNLFVVNCFYGLYFMSSTPVGFTNFNQYFYGGSFEFCTYNVYVQDPQGVGQPIALDDAYFHSCVIEGASSGGNAVYIGVGNTRIRFYGCSFENTNLSSGQTVIYDAGTVNTVMDCRFGSAAASGTIYPYQAGGQNYGGTFANNGVDMLTNNQTWQIYLQSGAQNINIVGNRINNLGTGGTYSLFNPQSGASRVIANDNLNDTVGGFGATSINDISGNILIQLAPAIAGTNTLDFWGNTVQGMASLRVNTTVACSGRLNIQSASGFGLATTSFVSGNTGNVVALNSSAFGPVGFFYIQASGGTTYKVPFMNS